RLGSGLEHRELDARRPAVDRKDARARTHATRQDTCSVASLESFAPLPRSGRWLYDTRLPMASRVPVAARGRRTPSRGTQFFSTRGTNMYHTLGRSTRGRRSLIARCATPLALLTAAVLLAALGCKKDNTTTTTGGGGAGSAPTTRPTGPSGGSPAMVMAVANIAPAKGAATQPAHKDVSG